MIPETIYLREAVKTFKTLLIDISFPATITEI